MRIEGYNDPRDLDFTIGVNDRKGKREEPSSMAA
jgi:hypothetical protein